jgi:hypothetical protein
MRVEPEYSRMVSELANHFAIKWYPKLITLKGGHGLVVANVSWKLFTLFRSRQAEKNSP